MRKFAILLAGAFMLLACREDDECVEKAQDPAVLCIAIYLPVCGCNGKTYGNACEAKVRGIENYTEGACPE